jgi:hypothetical protein
MGAASVFVKQSGTEVANGLSILFPWLEKSWCFISLFYILPGGHFFDTGISVWLDLKESRVSASTQVCGNYHTHAPLVVLDVLLPCGFCF